MRGDAKRAMKSSEYEKMKQMKKEVVVKEQSMKAGSFWVTHP